MKLNKQIIIGFSLSVLGCGVAQEASDCGSGDSISVKGENYCVYQLAVVVENGFNCPAGLPNLSQGTAIGICGNAPIEEQRFGEVREKFEEEFPEKVKKKPEDKVGKACSATSDCVGAPCTNGFCETLNNAGTCEQECEGKPCVDGVCPP